MLTDKLKQALAELSSQPPITLIPYENLFRECYHLNQDQEFGRWLSMVIEEIGIAKAENMAYYNGVAYGDDEELPF